jgi:hypothetical protein
VKYAPTAGRIPLSFTSLERLKSLVKLAILKENHALLIGFLLSSMLFISCGGHCGEDAQLALEKKMAPLLAGLDSDDFNARNQSEKALVELGPESIVLVRAALARTSHEDKKLRLRNILSRLEVGPIGSVDVSVVFENADVVESLRKKLSWEVKFIGKVSSEEDLTEEDLTKGMMSESEAEAVRFKGVDEILSQFIFSVKTVAKDSGIRLVLRGDARNDSDEHWVVPGKKNEGEARPQTAAELVIKFRTNPILFKTGNISASPEIAPGENLKPLRPLSVDLTEKVLQHMNKK